MAQIHQALIKKDVVVTYKTKEGGQVVYQVTRQVSAQEVEIQKLDNNGQLMNKRFTCPFQKVRPCWLQVGDEILDKNIGHKKGIVDGFSVLEKPKKRGGGVEYINSFVIRYPHNSTQDYISFKEAVSRFTVLSN